MPPLEIFNLASLFVSSRVLFAPRSVFANACTGEGGGVLGCPWTRGLVGFRSAARCERDSVCVGRGIVALKSLM